MSVYGQMDSMPRIPLRPLGRLSAPDGRDKNFSIARRISGTLPLPTQRLWFQDGWWGDQGDTSTCTAYAWTHYHCDVMRLPAPAGGLAYPRSVAELPPQVRDFYCREQTRDPWPGDCVALPHYDGSSVRAGASVSAEDLTRSLVNPGTKKIEYLWAFDIATIMHTVANYGPMVIGVDWWNSMFQPDRNGVIVVDYQSGMAGGHAVMLNGFVRVIGGNHWYRGKNNWGRKWGDKGNFWIRQRELAKLVDPSAEFCYLNRRQA